jgi:uncharacterized membrane protein YkgB
MKRIGIMICFIWIGIANIVPEDFDRVVNSAKSPYYASMAKMGTTIHNNDLKVYAITSTVFLTQNSSIPISESSKEVKPSS